MAEEKKQLQVGRVEFDDPLARPARKLNIPADKRNRMNLALKGIGEDAPSLEPVGVYTQEDLDRAVAEALERAAQINLPEPRSYTDDPAYDMGYEAGFGAAVETYRAAIRALKPEK